MFNAKNLHWYHVRNGLNVIQSLSANLLALLPCVLRRNNSDLLCVIAALSILVTSTTLALAVRRTERRHGNY